MSHPVLNSSDVYGDAKKFKISNEWIASIDTLTHQFLNKQIDECVNLI